VEADMPIPAIETLELRLCLSASLADGVLTVTGTPGTDRITVTVKRGQFLVRERGVAPESFAAGGVQKIFVRSLDGADRIRVDRTTVPAEIDAGPGDDIVVAGFGNDVILGGDGRDRITARSGDDQLFGQAGTDNLDGGNGTDTSDFDLDLLQRVENVPDITEEQIAQLSLVFGQPLAGFSPSVTTADNAGNLGGVTNNFPADLTPQPGGTGTGTAGSIVLDRSGQPIDSLTPTFTTSTSPIDDVLAGTAGTRGSSGLNGSILNETTNANTLTNSSVSSSLFAPTPAAASSATSAFFG
jgi:hypothetical protein